MAIALFLNSKSGSVSDRTGEELHAAFGQDLVIEDVRGPNLTERVKHRVQRGYQVVAAGGDGTVAAVAEGLIGLDAVLGILPLGTLNHLARDLNIPIDLQAAVQVIREARATRIDTGCLNGEAFVNNSALGLYPRLVQYRETLEAKGMPRWAALCRAAFYILTRYQTMLVEFEIDGRTIARRTPLVFVGNNIYTLHGLKAGSRDSLQDGVLTVVIARHQNPWSFLVSSLRALAGFSRSDESMEVMHLSQLTVRTRKKQVVASIDGELTLMQSPLHYSIRPHSLSVIIPAA